MGMGLPGSPSSPSSPGFLARLVALPFSPVLWRESPERGSGGILLALILWALAAGVLSGIRAAEAVRASVYAFASYYEENADPLLLDNGRFSLTGDRILYIDDPDGRSTILIDPEETVPDEEVTATQSLVVRADRVVLRQPAQTREWQASEVANIFGEHVLFDGDWLRRAADRWLHPAVLLGYPVIAALLDVIACALYACAVGLLLLLLRGQWLGLGYAACVTIALATSSFTIAAGLGLTLLGIALPLAGYVFWPLVMTALGFVALAGRVAPEASPPM